MKEKVFKKQEEVADLFSKMLVHSKDDNVKGVITFTVTASGDWTEQRDDLFDELMPIISENECVFRALDIDVKKKNSSISLEVYDGRYLMDYIMHLEKKSKMRVPKEYLSMLNRAISLLDDYNTEFGKGEWNKTNEITVLDEMMQLMK